MKLLQLDNGGRPFANDDILTLQTEVLDAAEATLQGAPAMVLSGCHVTRAQGAATGDISAGFMWIAGQICRYLGANGVPLPAEVIAGPADETDYRPYQTGGSKACMSELTLITQASGTAAAGTERVVFLAGPVGRYAKWLESQHRYPGELQEAVNLDTSLYDQTGKGWPDLAWAGWALANGQNGTADLRGRFRVGYSDVAGDYDTPGKKAGAETVQLTAGQNGRHNHVAAGQFNYNRALRLAPLNSNTTAAATDGNGNGGAEVDIVSSSAIVDSGNGEAHENRPPYYVTVVWQWIGL